MPPPQLVIGGVHIAPNVILAPMSGITDSAFRRTIKDANPGDVGLVVSELISVEALSRGNAKTARYMRFAASEQPIAIQLFGSEPELMAEAARIAAAAGAAIIDINCGCPVPKVVKRGGGAELMRRPQLLAAIVRAVRRAVEVPVTVKMRAGWDASSRNAVDVARMLEGEGTAAVSIHGRTRVQLYSGESDWDIIAQVKAAVRIPIIGSGDIADAATALQRLPQTGVDGVMIGRAALRNPWLFRDIARARRGEAVSAPTTAEVRRVLLTMVERLAADIPPNAALGRARGLVCRMTSGLRYGGQLRDAVMHAPSLAATLDLLRAFPIAEESQPLAA